MSLELQLGNSGETQPLSDEFVNRLTDQLRQCIFDKYIRNHDRIGKILAVRQVHIRADFYYNRGCCELCGAEIEKDSKAYYTVEVEDPSQTGWPWYMDVCLDRDLCEFRASVRSAG